MLKAKLDSVRKNKKGFSLVELIIVIAIMVALIAVMAPAFVKYVQKSRDSALATAAESFYTAAQTFYGDPDETPQLTTGSLSIQVQTAASGSAPIVITPADDAGNDMAAIKALAGVDTTKKMGASDYIYTITVTKADQGYTFSMTNTKR